MAEFLIMNRNNEHSDSEMDIRGCWKIGDIVSVKENGFQWGNKELDTNIFIIIEIPGLSLSNARQYVQAYRDGSGNILKKSLWNYNTLTETFTNKNTLVTITKLQLSLLG